MIQNRDKIHHNTAGGIFLGAAGGYYIGMKEAFIRVWVSNVKKSRLSLLMENMITMDSSNMDDEGLARMLAVIRRKRVKCLVGYSSALEELSRYITNHGVDTSGFRVKIDHPDLGIHGAGFPKKLQKQFGCRCGPGTPMKKTVSWVFRTKKTRDIRSIPRVTTMRF